MVLALVSPAFKGPRGDPPSQARVGAHSAELAVGAGGPVRWLLPQSHDCTEAALQVAPGIWAGLVDRKEASRHRRRTRILG